MTNSGSVDGEGLNRRKVLSGLSAAGAMGLAGCSDILGGGGNGGNGSGEQGERVPTQTMQHYTGWYRMENAAEAISEQMPERLGVDLEVTALDIATAVGNVSNDNRFSALPLYYISTTPDGSYSLERYSIDEAGSAGTNNSNWANCVYSVLIHEHRGYPDQEERQEILDYAQQVRSEDLAVMNTGLPSGNTYGYHPDQVEFDTSLLGDSSLARTNPTVYESFETVGGTQRLRIATEQTYLYDTTNFWASPAQIGPWNNLIHSKLFYWGPDNEFGNNDIAESVEISDDGLEYTVNIDSSATFHNGDPVTAEDVKFTFDWLTDNPGVFLDAPRVGMSIEADDETTAVFTMDEAYAPLVTRDFHNWGILHRDTWVDAGALEDASSAQPSAEEMVGSGPYEITSFSSGQGMTLEPFADHHTFDVTAPLAFRVYRDSNSLFQALRAGDLAIGPVTPPQRQQAEESDDINIEIAPGIGTSELIIMPQYPMAPTKFFEFREAVAMALNYQEIEALTTLGQLEPDLYAAAESTAHPVRAPDDMLYEQGNGNVQGDLEAAKQVLEEAGWSWDNNDNLRYPPDADLSPRWEAEGVPDPDDYPCLNDEGEYVRPDDIDLPIDV